MTATNASKSNDFGLNEYLEFSRSWAAGLVFILPLLMIYEFGALYLGEGQVAAAQWAQLPFVLLGRRGLMVFNILIIIVFLGASISLAQKRSFYPAAFPLMLLEAGAYALVLGPLISTITGLYMTLDIGDGAGVIESRIIIAAAGAGGYEELIFRGLLIGALFYGLTKYVKLQPVLAGVISILTSAVLFSIAHFLAPTESFEVYAFFFRMFAAIALTAIFVFRGIGITCYTHAIYNVLVYLMYR